MTQPVTIKTLGKFSVHLGDMLVSSESGRTQRVWKLFKRLITSRHRPVPADALVRTLWGADEPEDTQRSLDMLLARLRRLLTADGEERNCILYLGNSYQWNPQVQISLDVLDFESLIKQAETADNDEAQIFLLKQAVELYNGSYLEENAGEMWILSVANYYKRLYLKALGDLCALYSKHGLMNEIIELSTQAINYEPFEEVLHERIIRTLYLQGEVIAAKKHYDSFLTQVQQELGAEPSEDFLAQFRGLWESSDEQENLDNIKGVLDGEISRSGAYFCTVDIFNQIYVIDKRAEERMRFPVFLALITVTLEELPHPGGSRDDNQVLRQAMFTLRHCMMSTLRRGDIVTQYTKNQFLLMLSAYQPENAEAALSRVKHLFLAAISGVAIDIQFSVSQVGAG